MENTFSEPTAYCSRARRNAPSGSYNVRCAVFLLTVQLDFIFSVIYDGRSTATKKRLSVRLCFQICALECANSCPRRSTSCSRPLFNASLDHVIHYLNIVNFIHRVLISSGLDWKSYTFILTGRNSLHTRSSRIRGPVQASPHHPTYQKKEDITSKT